MKTVKKLKLATQTQIFTFVAKKFGNENLKQKVYNYLVNHSAYGRKIAYSTAFNKKLAYNYNNEFINLPIKKLVESARYYKSKEKNTYSKVLIEGNTNIYWASPVYQHSDYNKSIAIAKSEVSLKIMDLVNSYISK
jgi:hypothetical protein